MELIVLNVVGWLVLQLAIAWSITRVPAHWFARDSWWMRVQDWEIHFYRRWLRIRDWKSMLPDGAPWVGGTFRKRVLERRDSSYFRQFVTETRRGELAHWLMLLCFPLFFFWNPRWAWWVMGIYAIAANLPCIVVQRYNRYVGLQLLQHRSRYLPLSRPASISHPEIHVVSGR